MTSVELRLGADVREDGHETWWAGLPVRRILVLAALVSAYCIYVYRSQSPPPPLRPPLLPVDGRVFVNGSPLDRGLVTYRPDSSKENSFDFSPSGEVQPDGRYTLTTRGEAGAPAGWYRVTIFATRTPPPANPGGWVPDWLVDEKYTRFASTDQLVEVKDSPRLGDYDLRLTLSKPREVEP